MARIVHRYDGEIWTVSDIFSTEECRDLITRGEAVGFEAADVRTSSGPQKMENVRNNDRALLEDSTLSRALWERVREFVPAEIDGCRAAGLYTPFRFYRYDVGQRFKRHKDGRETIASGEQSRLTFLVYLNEDYEGGETVFTDYVFRDGERITREVRVKPETGTGLFFVHERWHEGAPIIHGRKYVLRSDVLYEGISK